MLQQLRSELRRTSRRVEIILDKVEIIRLRFQYPLEVTSLTPTRSHIKLYRQFFSTMVPA